MAGKQNRTKPNKFKRMYYMSVILILGDLPNPSASNKALADAIREKLVINSGGMELDPEIPDTYMSLVMASLSKTGLLGTADKRVAVVRNIQEFGKLGSKAGSFGSMSAADKETFGNNLLDVGQELLSGNIGGAIGEGADLFGDLFGGLFD